MNLYQWILYALTTASDRDPSPATLFTLDGMHERGDAGCSYGLSSFLDAAATEYARLMLWPDRKEEYFSRPAFYKEMEYFSRALYRLLTEFSPIASNLTLRLNYSDFSWNTVEATSWSYDKEDGYRRICWGIEYTDWNEWLGMTVEPQFFQLPAPLVLAHVIWEMTWNGQPGDPAYEERMNHLFPAGQESVALCK